MSSVKETSKAIAAYGCWRRQMLGRKTLIAYILLAIGSCVATKSALAQTTLEPCEMEFMGDYYQGVDNIIDHAIGQSPGLSLTELPSFFPESGVRLIGNNVYFVELKSSFWDQGQSTNRSGRDHLHSPSQKIKTKIFSAVLSPELVNSIKQTYIKAISNAKPSHLGGLDGVSYRFSTPTDGCGTTWSPGPATPNGRLVKLLALLEGHSKLSQPSAMQSSEKSITELLNSIKNGS